MRQRAAHECTPHVREDERELFQQLLEARKNLSLAQTATRRELELSITLTCTEKGSDYRQCIRRDFGEAHSDNSEAVYGKTLEDVGA